MNWKALNWGWMGRKSTKAQKPSPGKNRNAAAAALSDPLFRKRVVKDKKKEAARRKARKKISP